MFNELKKQYSSIRILVNLAIIALSLYLLQVFWQFVSAFSDIIIMILLAWLLSFVLEPLINLISSSLNIAKIWSALLIYTFFAIFFSAAAFIFIPIAVAEFNSLSVIVPKSLLAFPQALLLWNNTVAKSLEIFISLLPSLATLVVETVLMLILSFYFIVDKEKITSEIFSLAPTSWHKNLKFIQTVVDTTFSSFFRIQVIFALVAGISTWIILTLFGIPYAALISIAAALLTLIPVIGQFLGAIPPFFIALITNPSAPLEAILIYVVLVLIQQVVFNVFGPKLMGNAFKLHPLVVFLSIIVGYKIAGAIGAVFVVPVLSIFVIVIKRLAPYFLNPQPQVIEEK